MIQCAQWLQSRFFNSHQSQNQQKFLWRALRASIQICTARMHALCTASSKPEFWNQVQDKLSAVGLVMQAKTLALKSCSANQRWCNVRTKTTVGTCTCTWYLYIRSYYMRGLTIAQKAIKGSHMYKCNITYRYGFIQRWNPRIYNMCRQALAHEQENFNNFPCSGIFGDFRGFYTGGLTFCNFGINLIYGS